MFKSFAEIEAAGWERLSDEGFFELIGPLWRAPERPGHRYGFLIEPRHRNRAGFVHGGMLMSVADRAMGPAARDSDPAIMQATVQLSYDFIDGAKVGEFVEIQCEVMRKTRTLVFTRATLTVGERIIGTTSGIWKIIKRDV